MRVFYPFTDWLYEMGCLCRIIGSLPALQRILISNGIGSNGYHSHYKPPWSLDSLMRSSPLQHWKGETLLRSDLESALEALAQSSQTIIMALVTTKPCMLDLHIDCLDASMLHKLEMDQSSYALSSILNGHDRAAYNHRRTLKLFRDFATPLTHLRLNYTDLFQSNQAAYMQSLSLILGKATQFEEPNKQIAVLLSLGRSSDRVAAERHEFLESASKRSS